MTSRSSRGTESLNGVRGLGNQLRDLVMEGGSSDEEDIELIDTASLSKRHHMMDKFASNAGVPLRLDTKQPLGMQTAQLGGEVMRQQLLTTIPESQITMNGSSSPRCINTGESWDSRSR